MLVNFTSIVIRTRKVIEKMDNPIADSAAAALETNEANDDPSYLLKFGLSLTQPYKTDF